MIIINTSLCSTNTFTIYGTLLSSSCLLLGTNESEVSQNNKKITAYFRVENKNDNNRQPLLIKLANETAVCIWGIEGVAQHPVCVV